MNKFQWNIEISGNWDEGVKRPKYFGTIWLKIQNRKIFEFRAKDKKSFGWSLEMFCVGLTLTCWCTKIKHCWLIYVCFIDLVIIANICISTVEKVPNNVSTHPIDIFCEFLTKRLPRLGGQTYFFVFLYMVVAQVVERWHSVQAGPVQIPDRTLAFFSSEMLSIYSHWVSGFFLITWNRTVHTLPSSFLFPIIIYHCENYQS